VTNTYKDKVPADYVRKQTLKNAERYITEELKRHEEKVLTAGERAIALEQELFSQVREQVAAHTAQLQETAALLGQLDCLGAFAQNAAQYRYAAPVVDDSLTLEITDGRHPVLDQAVEFVPNDTLLDTQDNRLLIITGPNMAGKSTYIRQVALLVIMAQMGSFVPVGSMHLGAVDRICTRVGASDDLVRGKSTFMVEMNETANILHNATERSLIILDEVGRGTSTYDGLSLAWAVAEYVAGNLNARTLFATHYHQLTDLAHTCEGVKNYNVAVREWGDKVVFLHKIVEGASDRSYGIHVARLAGIPKEVIERALVILGNIEAGSADASDMPTLIPRDERSSKSQLTLFEDIEKKVAKKLRDVDIDLTTPLEALNILKEIMEMLD
jgi:DNA mismatch repair protein MutS